jgi:CBS domain-containing protein
MKVRDLMNGKVVDIGSEETVSVAARRLLHYNIGTLLVRDDTGRLCGMLTDRDIVTRCLASGRAPEKTRVRDIMTSQLYVASPDMDISLAAHLMGRQQVRRLPVTEDGKLCGILSLGDMAGCEECALDAADAYNDIANGISSR